jgi:hypothetical protein
MWQARGRFGSGDGAADQSGPAYRASRTGRSARSARSDRLERAERADRSRPVAPAAFHLHATSSRPPKAADPVSVLIPVRHDTDTAMTAVIAALRQRGVDRLDVVVLDEGCPEATRAALRRAFGDDPRVRILSSAPLPNGWSPRAHRGHQLAVAARGRVLLFAEACAPLGPDAAAAAAALLRGERLDLAVLDTGRPRAVDTAESGLASGPGTGSGSGSGSGSGIETGAGAGAGSGPETGAGAGTGGEGRTGVGIGAGTSAEGGSGAGKGSGEIGATASRSSRRDGTAGARRLAEGRSQLREQVQAQAQPQAALSSDAARRFQNSRFQSVRTHPGRFAVAVDAGAYWRFGGYRAAAADSDPLALLRTMRRASGRVAVADGRRVIPPASLVDPAVPDGDCGYSHGYGHGRGHGPVGLASGSGGSGSGGTGGVPTGSMTNRSPFVDITDTARRLLAALSSGRR